MRRLGIALTMGQTDKPIILIIWGDMILVRRLDGVGHLWNSSHRDIVVASTLCTPHIQH
jgi:hypothetical protein